MTEFIRATAYKIWISDLLNGSYTKGPGQFDQGFVEVLGMKISKVNIIGGIVDKFDGENNTSVTIDDSSGNLRLKAWNEDSKILKELNVGDLVLTVGKVKEYNNQIFVVPEIVRKIDNALWLKARRLELIQMYGETKRVDNVGNRMQAEEIVDDELKSDNSIIIEDVVKGEASIGIKEKIISLIESLDKGEGAEINEVLRQSEQLEQAKSAVEDLIKDGEIFELKKDRLRIM